MLRPMTALESADDKREARGYMIFVAVCIVGCIVLTAGMW